MYEKDIHPACQEEINRACKKNPVLENAIERKMNQILIMPWHYKPL